MAARALACLAYLPLPGAAALWVLGAPADRLVRYHAWQGGALVALLYAWLLAWGFVAVAVPKGAALEAVSMAAGAGLAAGLLAILGGAVSAARGRFARIPLVYRLLSGLGR